MSDHKLVMHAIDPEAPLPPEAAFRARLTDIGLLGPPVDYFGTTHYRQGPRFNLLLPFASSHEAVPLVPTAHGLEMRPSVDSASLVSIELCTADDIQFFGGANVESPACSACGYVLQDWATVVSAWHESRDTYHWSCPRCRRVHRPWTLDYAVDAFLLPALTPALSLDRYARCDTASRASARRRARAIPPSTTRSPLIDAPLPANRKAAA
jgi:hypothetical protein